MVGYWNAYTALSQYLHIKKKVGLSVDHLVPGLESQQPKGSIKKPHYPV
jgi:hypothetical protein